MSFSQSYILAPSGDKSRGKILVLHGLTACPDEVRQLCEALAEAGFEIVVPIIPGHGSNIEQLGKVELVQWLRFAEEQLQELLKCPEPKFLIGVSFGGLLSLYLASLAEDRVSGLVSIAPPFLLRSRLRRLLLSALWMLPETLLNQLGSIEKSNRKEGRLVLERQSYQHHSIAAGARLIGLKNIVETELGKVVCPMQILQDPKEHHVLSSSAVKIKSLSNSSHVNIEWIPGAEHEMLAGPKHELVKSRVVEFIEKLVKP